MQYMIYKINQTSIKYLYSTIIMIYNDKPNYFRFLKWTVGLKLDTNIKGVPED